MATGATFLRMADAAEDDAFKVDAELLETMKDVRSTRMVEDCVSGNSSKRTQ